MEITCWLICFVLDHAPHFGQSRYLPTITEFAPGHLSEALLLPKILSKVRIVNLH